MGDRKKSDRKSQVRSGSNVDNSTQLLNTIEEQIALLDGRLEGEVCEFKTKREKRQVGKEGDWPHPQLWVLCFAHLVQIILAVWAVGLHYSSNFVDATV